MTFFNQLDQLKADPQYDTYCRLMEEADDGH